MADGELRAYIAKVELEYLVVARSRGEAKQIAKGAARDDYIQAEDFELSDATYIPCLYDGLDDIVHNQEGRDITVAEALALPGGYKHVPPESKPDGQ